MRVRVRSLLGGPWIEGGHGDAGPQGVGMRRGTGGQVAWGASSLLLLLLLQLLLLQALHE